ncbi:MAG TPA: hypothetical protein VIL20_03885, partial [Sandaracinaceae bacterium]
LAAGSTTSCAIRADTLQPECWGSSNLVPASLRHPMLAIAMSFGNMCGIRADTNAAVCSTVGLTPPPEVDGTLGGAIAIGVGMQHACAIQLGSQAVYCWGENTFGAAAPPRSVTRSVVDPDGWATALAVGRTHACAIRGTDDGVVCWGRGLEKQTIMPVSVSPDGVVGQTLGNVVAIAAGETLGCAITAGTHAVVCWGGVPRYSGDVGSDAEPPAAVNGTQGTASAIAVRGRAACAVQRETGDVVCWGTDPPDVAPPPRVEGGARALTFGRRFVCAIREPTGAVVCFGDDSYHAHVPPPSVDGTQGTATALASHGSYVCAIQAPTGAVVCWGDVWKQGQLPPGVDGTLGTASALSIGPPGLAAAIRTDIRRLYGWTTAYVPLSPTPSAPVVAVGAGAGFYCVILEAGGAVECWPANESQTAPVPPPTVDGTLGTALAIDVHGGTALAIRAPEPSSVTLGIGVFGALSALAGRRSRRSSGRTTWRRRTVHRAGCAVAALVLLLAASGAHAAGPVIA